MSVVRLSNTFILCFVFKASNCILQSILRIGTASEIGVFDLWNDTGVYCDKGDLLFRHDYIDRINDTCLREIHIHFKTKNGDFIIRYNGPFGPGTLDVILFKHPSLIEDTATSSVGSPGAVYRPHINTEHFEFLLLNEEQTMMFAAIYYLSGDSFSPSFGFNNGGFVYREKQRLWVSSVFGFSDEYTEEIGWTASEIIGPFDLYPQYGDLENAWTPNCCIPSVHHITVGYAQELFIEEIHIYETYHAGGVKRISVKSPTANWVTVWETATVMDITHSRIFEPSITKLSFPSKELKIEIDLSMANTWVELDAVQIVGLAAGDEIPTTLTSERPVTSLEIVALTEDNPICNDVAIPRNTTFCPGPHVSIPIPSVDVKLGDVAQIPCNIFSNKKIVDTKWTYNDVDIIPDNNKYKGVQQGSHVLTVTNWDLNDVGFYTCYASDIMGESQSAAIYANVTCDSPVIQGNTTFCPGPNVSIPVNLIAVQIGDSIHISCNIVTDYKIIRVRWTHEHLDLVLDNDKYSGVTNSSHVLEVGNWSERDEGSYECYASTIFGEGKSEAVYVQTVCPCSCAYKERVDYWASQNVPNYTMEEWREVLKPQLIEIKQNLSVDKKHLSSYIRKLNSAKDERTLSQTMGWVGILVITIVCALFIFFDVTSMKIHTEAFRNFH